MINTNMQWASLQMLCTYNRGASNPASNLPRPTRRLQPALPNVFLLQHDHHMTKNAIMMLFFDCSSTTRKHKLSGSAKKRLAEREIYFSLRCYENLHSFSQNCMIKSKFQMLFSMTATRHAWASTLSNDNSSSARRSRKRPGVATFSDHRPSSTKNNLSVERLETYRARSAVQKEIAKN